MAPPKKKVGSGSDPEGFTVSAAALVKKREPSRVRRILLEKRKAESSSWVFDGPGGWLINPSRSDHG